jgi:decaprenylphospho-beta-D-ribofuranose 2-oxidase
VSASAPAPAPAWRLLSGWGRTAPSAARVVRPTSVEALVELLGESGARRPVVARGLGRCYGDAAQSAGGTVVDTTALAGVRRFDPATGTLSVGAGTSLDALMRLLVPRGWFVPVTPGTRQVTVGGAVAADIHGKNHHRDGSFAAHVRSLLLASPTGLHRLSPGGEDPEGFWATAGGMGMTGVVVEVELQMVPVETSAMRVDTERAPDLDRLMAALRECDARHRYSVAWIDCLATGARLGRGVLTGADHAARAELPAARRHGDGRSDGHGDGHGDGALAFAPRPALKVPITPPGWFLNPLTVGAFNEMWYRKAPRRRTGELQGLSTFFHPLDGVAGWNRLYGRRGFLQYQFAVPDAASEVVRVVLERLASARAASFLGVLKRFGPGDPGPLSFPLEGWTLALDLPLGGEGLGPLLDGVDELVAGAGGRVYLAKDARLRPELLEAMYPGLERWRRTRRRFDPEAVMGSDLSRRLDLVGGAGPP